MSKVLFCFDKISIFTEDRLAQYLDFQSLWNVYGRCNLLVAYIYGKKTCKLVSAVCKSPSILVLYFGLRWCNSNWEQKEYLWTIFWKTENSNDS